MQARKLWTKVGKNALSGCPVILISLLMLPGFGNALTESDKFRFVEYIASADDDSLSKTNWGIDVFFLDLDGDGEEEAVESETTFFSAISV